MKIAVICSNRLQSAGAFQYELLNCKIINNQKKDNLKYYFFCFSEKVKIDFKNENIDLIYLNRNFIDSFIDFILTFKIFYKLLKRIENIFFRLDFHYLSNLMQKKFINSYEKKLDKYNIDIIYFPSPSIIAPKIINIPYIFTLFDLNFRSHLEFPELTQNKEYDKRDFYYDKVLKKSHKVIVCSKTLKNETIEYYNINNKRIEIFPYLPNINKLDDVLNKKYSDKFNLYCKYIFYPATFYAHKNHNYIINLIKTLKNKYNIDTKAYFVGSNPGKVGNFNSIKQKIISHNLEKNIFLFEFIPNEAMPYFYKNAISLVMPTFIGPNNIPPLEAIAYDCPVLYSDLFEFREQFGKHVNYIDLFDIEDGVKKITLLMNDKIFLNQTIKLQKDFLSQWNEISFYDKLEIVFTDYKKYLDTWK